MTRRKTDVVPLREELEALVAHYRHLQNEHKRAAPDSAPRRRIEDRLLEVRERFDRMLAEWVQDPDLQQEWNSYLHYRGPEPSGPPATRPLVFRGVSDVSGSIVEVRGEPDEYTVEVDGALVERIAAAKDFAAWPEVRFRVVEAEFRETFDASQPALDALGEFLDDEGSSPPWDYASELLADGIVDVHFALTPRGRRALGRPGSHR
jgi:hypothetical protein